MRLPPMPSTRDVLRMYNLKCRKQLSQNMLLDTKLTSKLVTAGRDLKGINVIEVGPGAGSLTRRILEQNPKTLTVIEKDVRFINCLKMLQEASGNRLSIYFDDILSYNMKNLFCPTLSRAWDDPVLPKVHIIGNLPFNVATPLIIRWLKCISNHSNVWSLGRVSMTLTFQYEVGKRIAARSKDQTYRSRLSIMCQNWCHVNYEFTIPGRSFIPVPKVDVAVVNFVPRVKPFIPLEFDLVERIVYTIFSARQKNCKKTIGYLFPKNRREELTDKLLAVADVNPFSSSVFLTLDDFDRICHTYVAIIGEFPYLLNYNFRKGGLGEIRALADQNSYEYEQQERIAAQQAAEIKILENRNNIFID